MKTLLALVAVLILSMPVISHAGMKAPGILDDEDVITTEGLAKYKAIGIKIFTTDNIEYNNVDDEEMTKMKRELRDYQDTLAKTLRNNLEDSGFKAFIINDDEGAGNADMVVEGEFTSINLGSAAARIIFGFGAGQVGIETKGQVVDAKTGDVLAKFKHETTSGLDGSLDKWQMINREAADNADDITEFIVKLK